MIRGVDDLDAEVQSLEKQLPGHARLNDLRRQYGRGRAKRPHGAPGRAHAFGEARGQVAEKRVDEAAVDGREERVEELLHRLVDAELGPRQEEADDGEEVVHGPGGLGGRAAEGLAEDGVGLVLRLLHQDLEGVWGRERHDGNPLASTAPANGLLSIIATQQQRARGTSRTPAAGAASIQVTLHHERKLTLRLVKNCNKRRPAALGCGRRHKHIDCVVPTASHTRQPHDYSLYWPNYSPGSADYCLLQRKPPKNQPNC